MEVCESYESMSGLWRVTQSDDSSAECAEPEDYILLLHELKQEEEEGDGGTARALTGAKLSAGRLTSYLEGTVEGESVAYAMGEMDVVLECTAGILRGEWRRADGTASGSIKVQTPHCHCPCCAAVGRRRPFLQSRPPPGTQINMLRLGGLCELAR